MEPTPVQALSYAPAHSYPSSRVFAAAVLVVAGLGLIALGGCFLIGVLILIDPPLAFGPMNNINVPPWTWRSYALAAALSVLATICFISAAWLLFLTTRNLLRSMSAAHVQSREPTQ